MIADRGAEHVDPGDPNRVGRFRPMVRRVDLERVHIHTHTHAQLPIIQAVFYQ
jgi:hypothetical protein